MRTVNEVDERVLRAMSGPDRIKILLRDAGFPSLATLSWKIQKHVQQISYCINGDREYPEIRDALAAELELSRDEIDELIDGPATEAA